MRTIIRLIGTSLALSGLLAVGEPTSAKAQELAPMIAKPHNAVQLLQNIKLAVERGFLLREDFYVESTLKRFFGGSEVIWRSKEGDGLQWGDITGFGNLVPPDMSPPRPSDGLGVSFRRETDNQGAISAILRLQFSTADPPKFSNVEQIYGSNWILQEPPDTPSPHRVIRAKIHPHGNDVIVYASRDSMITRSEKFEFFYNGALNIAIFELRERP